MHEGQFEYVVRLFGGVIMTNTGQKLSWIGRKIATFTEEQSESDELWAEHPISDQEGMQESVSGEHSKLNDWERAEAIIRAEKKESLKQEKIEPTEMKASKEKKIDF